MAVEQLPGQVREFARYLNGLLTRLDQGGGWCGVFWQRDPDGMRACLDGAEVPPWDVVESILQDLAAEYGPRAAAQETERARALHGASLAAYDARPGGREALGDRLDVMLREQRYAAERQSALGGLLRDATTREEVDSLRLDLAWARDDYERATARCAEIRARLDELDRQSAGGYAREALPIPPGGDRGDVLWVDEAFEPEGGEQSSGGARGEPDAWWDPAPRPTPEVNKATHGADDGEGTTEGKAAKGVEDTKATKATKDTKNAKATKATKQRSKRRPRGSARFAGVMEEDVEGVGHGAVPAMPAPPVTDRSPRGARFAGVAEEPVEQGSAGRASEEPFDDETRRATAETVEVVERLVRLRREGRSGEAHAVLAEVVHWPAARFPLLASELHRAGLDADWSTLLWEAVSLPADRLIAAADALVAAGRAGDGQQVLRQGVVRPAAEIGDAVLGFVGEGRGPEARALLDAYVRVRPPEEAARSADVDPQLLTPLLLEAARAVSPEHHRDLVHALRVAGYT
jgi:hypothetical protein